MISGNTKEFQNWFYGLQEIAWDDLYRFSPKLAEDTENPYMEFDYTIGRRYIKIIRKSGGQRSVHCFLDRTNGNVLKSATWNSPAKHARGNIFAEDNGLDCMGPYGAAYLR